ncbi:Common plant regulatory factor 1 like isoform 2 [Actinidia chinensis var. chinensis]|uniref:Common plant regulatory factor 1 like isoform 2 n=1 Tax=Actinidia chinensis var. chinensis TaxID=1590841 RepID=A0A2R6QIW8_ACTCC|nr:Common plant regulatory factor 1 like isoform 2 [Actinidia chinensis var. chinensis]
MGSSEDMKSPKSAKVSPSNQEHTNIHLYPDWANIQAYYGPGVPVPPSYLNPAVMAGHVPHPHLWSPPQTLMPSYGVPYSTIYSPGVVYAHPAVPLVAAPVSTQQLSNSSDITDQGLRKKLKSVDGVAMRDVKNNVDVDGEGLVHEASQSAECGIRASSNASDCNYGARPVTQGDANVTARSVLGIIVAPENAARQPVDTLNGKAKTIKTCAAATSGVGLPLEVQIQDQRQHKQERRKQANRESAKRSRLRKQAETEELMERYETLKVENIALKSEMNQLMEGSEKLRVESAALMEKLNVADVTHKEEMVLDEIEPDLAQPNCSEE